MKIWQQGEERMYGGSEWKSYLAIQEEAWSQVMVTDKTRDPWGTEVDGQSLSTKI